MDSKTAPRELVPGTTARHQTSNGSRPFYVVKGPGTSASGALAPGNQSGSRGSGNHSPELVPGTIRTSVIRPDRERVSWWRLLEGEELARLRAQAAHLGHVDRARVCFEFDHTTGKVSERIDMVFAPRTQPMASSSTGRAADFGPAGSGFEPPLANAPRTQARPDPANTIPPGAGPCVPRSVDRKGER